MKRPLMLALALIAHAAAGQAASLTGSWHCQVSEGDVGLARSVTYTADGHMQSRMAFQVKLSIKGQSGSAKISSSADGRYAVKGKTLAERIDKIHSPSISFTTEGKTTRLRGKEAERIRRRYGKQENIRYVIRSLTERRMVLQYVPKRASDESNDLRFICRRTSG